VREAGLEATLKVVGDRRDLPAAVDLSAYRIVQEAITNVLKHAQASRVEVTLDYQPSALVIAVSDNGGGASSSDGASAGHGLIGMRERVELFKGELTTGGSTLGGFTVRARLPL
jgi:signal transduction histidine kinase